MTDFQILKGKSTKLFTPEGNVAIDLIEYCWYLTTDTAEIFVAIPEEGTLSLKRLNEVDITIFESRLEDIEDRLSKLEQDKPVQTFAEREQFPSVGSEDILYVALDLEQTFVWSEGSYKVVGGGGSSGIDPDVINGGSALTA